MGRKVIFSIVLLILFGFCIASLYDFQMQFAEIVLNDIEPPWEITMSIVPMVLLLVIGGGLSILVYRYDKKKGKYDGDKQKWWSWTKASFLPPEFEESDEREKMITAKATRAAYASMWIAAPALTALLLLYPFIAEKFPYYPIIIILLLPITQIITYGVAWKRHYHR